MRDLAAAAIVLALGWLFLTLGWLLAALLVMALLPPQPVCVTEMAQCVPVMTA